MLVTQVPHSLRFNPAFSREVSSTVLPGVPPLVFSGHSFLPTSHFGPAPRRILLPKAGLAFLWAELVKFLGHVPSQERLMVVLEIPVGVIVGGLAQGGSLMHPTLAMRSCIRGWLPEGPVPQQ